MILLTLLEYNPETRLAYNQTFVSCNKIIRNRSSLEGEFLMSQAAETKSKLNRRLGLTALVFFGVGDILGAGVYALVGEVAGLAGSLSWLAFLVALVVASFTGLTYAELGGRFPRSGGESHFCHQAFRSQWGARVIGWMVFCSCVLSLSTVSRAFGGYLSVMLTDVPVNATAVSLLVFLAGVNFLGIRISSAANILCTVIETSGLLIVICVGIAFLQDASVDVPETPVVSGESNLNIAAILQAAGLAFFAFIGFEDMVNVAEEAKNPRRDMPRAIIMAALIAGVLYVIVVVVAVLVVDPDKLAASDAPMLLVVQEAAPWMPSWLFAGIALFAVANTGLLNFITASRLLYGMSNDGLLPQFLNKVHPKRKTPHLSVAVVLVTAITLAVSGTLAYLAGTTSVLLLSVFITMNAALVKLKTGPDRITDSFSVPTAIPIIGIVVCLVLLISTPWFEATSGIILVVVGMIISWYASRR